MKRGWTIGKTDGCNSGIALILPDEQLKVPVEYKGDSLAITAFVRCVSDDADILSVPHDAEPQSEPLWVQTVLIKVQEEFDLTRCVIGSCLKQERLTLFSEVDDLSIRDTCGEGTGLIVQH